MCGHFRVSSLLSLVLLLENGAGPIIEAPNARHNVDAAVFELVNTINELTVQVEQVAGAQWDQLASIDVVKQVIECRELASHDAHPQWPIIRLAVLVDPDNSARFNRVFPYKLYAIPQCGRHLQPPKLVWWQVIVETIVAHLLLFGFAFPFAIITRLVVAVNPAHGCHLALGHEITLVAWTNVVCLLCGF